MKPLLVHHAGAPVIVGTSRQAAALFAVPLVGLCREELWLCGLDDGCRACSLSRVAVGTRDGVQIDAHEVLRAVGRTGCEAFLLAHNHPSGDPRPSLADWCATVVLLAAADEAGFELVDHLIIGGDKRHASLRTMNESMFQGHSPGAGLGIGSRA